jgi:hypothetical protein
MTDDQFGEPVDDRAWQMPEPFVWHTKPSWWERFKEWLKGWNWDDA